MIDAKDFLRLHPIPADAQRDDVQRTDAEHVHPMDDPRPSAPSDVMPDGDICAAANENDDARMRAENDATTTSTSGVGTNDVDAMHRHIGSFGVLDGETNDAGPASRHGRRTMKRDARHRDSLGGPRRRRYRPGGFGSTSVGVRHPIDDGYKVAATSSTNVGKDADDMLEACRQSALTLLDAAPRSSGALRDRLLSKGFPSDAVDEVIERLTRVALIDDEAYARSALRYCVGRMYGERGALRELLRKKVDRSVAESLVEEARRRGVFIDAAWELGRRVAEKTVGLDDTVRRRRLWSAGGRRGHDAQTLREVQHALF